MTKSDAPASSLTAIDCHVHLNDSIVAAGNVRSAQMARYFGRERPVVEGNEMAEMYRSRGMRAVLVNTTDTILSGRSSVPNDHLAQVVAKEPDVFRGFGVVDPWQGKGALLEARRCKEELGLVGIGELNPARQHFFPNDPRFYPLWQVVSDLGLIVMFHSGYAASGSGTPGGGGVKLRYGNPMYVDDLAADFPDLKIICAHPGWPWESEALAVTLHKANIYLDLSGWAPKYFSAELLKYVNSRISDKVLFGSDWPTLDVDRWLAEFQQLDLKPEVRHKVLLGNAQKLLGWDSTEGDAGDGLA